MNPSGAKRTRPAGTGNFHRFLRLFLVLAVLVPLCSADLLASNQPPGRPLPQHIVASGIKGTLILCGTGEVSREAVDQFFTAAGAKKGHVVVVRGAEAAKESQAITQRLLEVWDAKNLASFSVVRLPASGVAAETLQPLKQATAVWLAVSESARLRELLAGTPLGKECQALLQRGGAIAVAGRASEAASQLMVSTGDDGAKSEGSGLLPGSIVVSRPLNENGRGTLTAALKKNPGLVGYELAPGAALVANGRNVRGVGGSPVTVHLAASSNHKAMASSLEKKKGGDLTTLRRQAVQRGDTTWPPVKPGTPVVEKGSLVVVGGGSVGQDILARFVELAGGKKASIVIFPAAKTGALTEKDKKDKIGDSFIKHGARSYTVVVGREREEVERPEYIKAMREATGLWFHGGRQGKIVDAYEGTQIHDLMYGVLERGGVIGGSSAGASIQCEYLVRGSPGGGGSAFEGYERGFYFLPGVAVDQHFSQRKRFGVMTQLMDSFPQFLGIGIDESTAIIVQGSVAEVMGKGKIHVYDRNQKVEKGKQDYEIVPLGGRYDLKERKALPPAEKKSAALRYRDEAAVGIGRAALRAA